MTYLACYFFWWINLLCLRSVPLLFLVFIPYGIYSDTWMVRCTNRVLHVMTTMLYILAYRELIILSLVGIDVWSCNTTIYRYVYMMIDEDGVLISGVYLGLFFLTVELCPTIGGGSLHLHCIFPIWSGSLKYIFLSMHCWLCDYLGWPTDNWYTYFAWLFLILLMLRCTWCITLGLFHGFLNLL